MRTSPIPEAAALSCTPAIRSCARPALPDASALATSNCAAVAAASAAWRWGCFQPVAGCGGPAVGGVPVSFPQLLKPRAEGLQPSVDLPPAAWQGPGLAAHA